MTKLLLLVAVAAAATVQLAAQGTAAPSKPTRINRAIELLEQGQPVYYDTAGSGGYEQGRKYAQTPGDYINYEMEHGVFDFTALRDFMRGLVDAGPTRSGHRTPAVIVTLPILGLDEAGMRANHWVIHQTLATGVHGILLCHARVPEAVRVMIETSRYPFAPKTDGLAQGLRGSGSATFAAQIWGVATNDYLRKADPWPLNKEGELLFGAKIEDSYALENAERTTRVPGLAFAEWGPGDMGYWLLGMPQGRAGAAAAGARAGAPGAAAAGARAGGGGGPTQQPVMQAARARVLKATQAAKIFFLNTCSAADVGAMIKEGVMICAGTGGAETGRKLTKRTMPY
jgi:4-hydroxy-2-oxoheptanedioate aldolase